MTPDVVFVTGCSRSGTTALVNVLNTHPAVVIGMERYKYRYPVAGTDELRMLLTPKRFFDFRTEDTNVLPDASERWRTLYEAARTKLISGTARVLGDKPLAAPRIAQSLVTAFPAARWVVILRDLVHVAASFEARANDPHDRAWPLRNGYRRALRQWTDTLRTTRLLEDRMAPDAIYRMTYEDFFAQDTAQVDVLRAFLRVEPDDRLIRGYEHATSDWPDRASRAPALFPAAQEWLQERRPKDLEERFRRRAAHDRAAWGR